MHSRRISPKTKIIAVAITLIVIVCSGLLFLAPVYGVMVPAFPGSASTSRFVVTGDARIDSSIASDLQGLSPHQLNYSVDHETPELVSISAQGSNGPDAQTQTFVATYSRTSGLPVRTKELMADEESYRAFQSFARGQLRNSTGLDSSALEEFTDFALTGDNEIVFPIAQGTSTFKLPLNQLHPYLAAERFGMVTTPQPSDLGKCPEHCVAITYDDGPDEFTPQVLDSLQKRGAHATFFVIGYKVGLFPHMVQRTVAEGHEVGNHSWNHPKLNTLTSGQISWQLSQTNNIIAQTTGSAPKITRPPYGATNGAVSAVSNSLGQPIVMWSVDTSDWRDRDPELVCKRAVEGAKPGSIILMHDLHKTTANATPCVVEGLQQRGFSLVTVSELQSTQKQQPL